MKILIGILVIVLAVYLDSVESGTPLETGFPSRPGAAPKPVPVPSARRQTGRGGRQGRQQSRSTSRAAAPPEAAPKAAPEASPSAARPVHFVDTAKEKTPTGVHIEQPHRGSIKLEKNERQQSGKTPQTAAKSTPTPEKPPPSPETLLGLNASQEAVPRGIYMEHPKRGFIKITEGLDVALFKFRHIVIGILADEDILPIFNRRHEIIRIDYNQNGLRIPMDPSEARLWGIFGKYAQFMRQLPPAFV